MDEKIVYRLWRKYLAAARANTVTEWKKYLLSCLRANVFPPVAKGLDFMGFVESIKDNIFETTVEDSIFETSVENEQEEIENEHE